MDTERFKLDGVRGTALGRVKKAFAAFVLGNVFGVGNVVLQLGASGGAWDYGFAVGISQVLVFLAGVCGLVLLCQLVQLWRLLR